MIAIVFVVVILSLAYVGLQGKHVNVDINAQFEDLIDEPKRYADKYTQVDIISDDDYIMT